MRLRYIELFKKKKKEQQMTEDEKKELHDLEFKLSYEDLRFLALSCTKTSFAKRTLVSRNRPRSRHGHSGLGAQNLRNNKPKTQR